MSKRFQCICGREHDGLYYPQENNRQFCSSSCGMAGVAYRVLTEGSPAEQAGYLKTWAAMGPTRTQTQLFLSKIPNFDPCWPAETRQNWLDAVNKIREMFERQAAPPGRPRGQGMPAINLQQWVITLLVRGREGVMTAGPPPLSAAQAHRIYK
jgi:hypothetical protein